MLYHRHAVKEFNSLKLQIYPFSTAKQHEDYTPSLTCQQFTSTNKVLVQKIKVKFFLRLDYL